MIHKETGKQLRTNDTSTGLYRDETRVIQALKTSGLLRDLGLRWDDIELVDYWGRKMVDLRAVAAQEGRYALRHREGWYWQHPHSKRIWYAQRGPLEIAWRVNETHARQLEGRAAYRTPDKQGLEMVRGLPDGQIQVVVKWW